MEESTRNGHKRHRETVHIPMATAGDDPRSAAHITHGAIQPQETTQKDRSPPPCSIAHPESTKCTKIIDGSGQKQAHRDSPPFSPLADTNWNTHSVQTVNDERGARPR